MIDSNYATVSAVSIGASPRCRDCKSSKSNQIVSFFAGICLILSSTSIIWAPSSEDAETTVIEPGISVIAEVIAEVIVTVMTKTASREIPRLFLY